MDETSTFLYFCIAIVIVMLIALYIAFAVFLNNFNKKVTGTSTVMSWIPFANVYLLGKLTFNKDAGLRTNCLIYFIRNFETNL